MDTQRYQQAKRVTIISLFTNAILSVLKLIVGFLGHSQALIADGVHSLSDLLTDGLVLFAAKAGSHGPDEEHPYGHGRFETLVTVLLAVILLFVGVGIAIEALKHIFLDRIIQVPNLLVMVVALISVLANEMLFQMTLRVSKKIKSELLRANAWHNRSDALSSLVVLVGALATYFGFRWGDAIAAVIVSVLIVKMAASMGWRNMRELVDTGVDEATKKELITAINEIFGVAAVHQLRSRLLAGDIYLDVHVQVEPKISVSEGHFVSDQVMNYLYEHFSEVKDVTVHIDPEDDEVGKPSDDLPSRDDVLQILNNCKDVLPSWNASQRLILHYLNGCLHVEIFLSDVDSASSLSIAEISQQYETALQKLHCPIDVTVFFQ